MTPPTWRSPNRSRARRAGRRPSGSTPRSRRPPSPPHTTPDRSAAAAPRCSGRTSLCAASESATRHHRPAWPTAAAGSPCAQSPGCYCVRSGRHRSSRWLRSRSALAARAAPRRGSNPRLHRRGTRPTTRTRKTGTGPSVESSSVSRWYFSPRITPMAPPRGGPPTTSNPTTPRDAYLGCNDSVASVVVVVTASMSDTGPRRCVGGGIRCPVRADPVRPTRAAMRCGAARPARCIGAPISGVAYRHVSGTRSLPFMSRSVTYGATERDMDERSWSTGLLHAVGP